MKVELRSKEEASNDNDNACNASNDNACNAIRYIKFVQTLGLGIITLIIFI